MIVNLYQHGHLPSRPSSSRPSSTNSGGSRPHSAVRRLGLKDGEHLQQCRPFSARIQKTGGTRDQHEQDAMDEFGTNASPSKRPFTARARMQTDATRDTRIATLARASSDDNTRKTAGTKSMLSLKPLPAPSEVSHWPCFKPSGLL